MSFLDNILDIFFGDKKTKEAKKQQKAYNKQNRIFEKKVDRAVRITDCYAALAECEKRFNTMIQTETAMAKQMQSHGYSDEKQRENIRQAAIGLLVVDRAKLELSSVSTEEDFNSALNKLGQALSQIRRLDNTNPTVSNGVRKSLEQWYSMPLEGSEADKDPLANYMIPPETAQRINRTFVDNLMAGNSFSACMAYDSMENYSRMDNGEDLDALLNAIPKDPGSDSSDAAQKAFERANLG